MTGTGQGDERKAEMLRVTHDELDKQRDAYSRRASAVGTRASVLTGAAAISGGLQVSLSGSELEVFAGLAALIAAGLGFVAMWPREGDEPDAKTFYDEFLKRKGSTALDLEEQLFVNKAAVHDIDERSLLQRGRLLRVGFGCLTASVVIQFLHILFTHQSIPQ